MIKKILFCSIIFLLSALPIFAFESSDITDNLNYADLKAYNYDFDILLMDVIIPDNDGDADTLQSFTVSNNRSADNTDIAKITLWSDNGDNIWQGYMIDNKIVDAVRTDSRRWEFTDLNLEISVGGLRIYISAETDTDVTDDRRMQFEIDKLIDSNSNGSYDSGDTGMFMESNNDGPTDASFVSSYLYTLENRTSDILAPKVTMSDIVNGDSFELADEFVISGYAKDRMQGSTKFVKISLVPTGDNPIWKEANSLTTNFATWNYTATNLIVGDYDLQIYTWDWSGNSVISDLITISFTEPVVEPEEPTEPEIPIEQIEPEEPEIQKPAGVNDGDLVRAVGDYKVYVVKEDYSRWIQSAEIFNYYPHFNFLVLKEISQNELEYYTESWLIRADGDEKVYEINGDGTRHWINMTAEKFTQSGRDWNMVYIINEQERDFYVTGADVTK